MAVSEAPRLTFAEHIRELRKRLMWSLFFVAIGAGIGYALNSAILRILQKPLNESLYYTTPTGAFSFILKLCVVFGLIVALPMIVYQTFAFFGPVLPTRSKRSISKYVLVSVALAIGGISFAYFVSLPAALHFLVNFGSDSGDIKALITADEYFNFVFAYIAGFAVLFQLPLIISFINKIKPLKPSKLIGGTRYVVLGSFVIAAIITPTPDPLNQALMAGPVILLYFVSVAGIIVANLMKRRKKVSPSVPEVMISDIDKLLNEEPVVAMTSAPQSKPAMAVDKLIASTELRLNPHKPKNRIISDVMVGSPQRAFSSAPISPRDLEYRTVVKKREQPEQLPMRMGLISDFIPAP